MVRVTNITIKPQTGSDNTLFATWSFKPSLVSTNTGIKNGSLVSIKSGATYYNGVAIPSWVMSQKWYIDELRGDRAVLGRNESGSNNIQSPINTKYLTGSSGGSASVNTLDHYVVTWYYDSGDGVWFSNGSNDTKETYSTYSPPSNAKRVKIVIRPVSKTHKVNKKDTYYWSGTSNYLVYSTGAMPPDKPATPTVAIDDYILTASVINISDARTDMIEFQVYNKTTKFKYSSVKVVTRQAIWKCKVNAGGEYRVRCRAINIYGNSKIYSEWSDYSDTKTTIPSAPTRFTTFKANSDNSVYLKWDAVSNATSYTIEYTTKKVYFDSSGEVTSIGSIDSNDYIVTGLEPGYWYYFRLKAVNGNGESGWSKIAAVIVGTTPTAPTTWSSTTTAIAGEPLTLHWIHNSADGSDQTTAQIWWRHSSTGTWVNEDTGWVQVTPNPKTNDFYNLNTTNFKEGTTIQWKVRTAGITNKLGAFSVTRTIVVYAPPTLQLNLSDDNGNYLSTLTSFPLCISAIPGPDTQVPTGYYLSVTALEDYPTLDHMGNIKRVSKGEKVYSNYFDTSDMLLVELTPSDLDLEDGVEYSVTCTVSMDSGLTAEETVNFTVLWADVNYNIDAEIAIDYTNGIIAYITPYCIDENGDVVNDFLLSVYRRDFDGGFTEIVKNINSYQSTTITDPHPALDYARYRIIATDKKTGTVSFYDVPAHPVGEKAIIIQWAEEWTDFNASNEDSYEPQPWTGSLLRLPYNIDVSDNHRTDVELIDYIGRTYPVSYYGTHLELTSTWSVDIPKDDKETLYALRRLGIWLGDVYVREPSGSGYWASVDVSFTQSHCSLTIPVTLNITRVEGGV